MPIILPRLDLGARKKPLLHPSQLSPKSLRYGDRFFYCGQNVKHRGLRTPELETVLKRTLSDVMCDNVSGLGNVRENAFLADSEMKSCEDKNVLEVAAFVKGERALMARMKEEKDKGEMY